MIHIQSKKKKTCLCLQYHQKFGMTKRVCNYSNFSSKVSCFQIFFVTIQHLILPVNVPKQDFKLWIQQEYTTKQFCRAMFCILAVFIYLCVLVCKKGQVFLQIWFNCKQMKPQYKPKPSLKIGTANVICWKYVSWRLLFIQLIQTNFIFISSIHCLIELKFCKVSRNSFSNR